MRGMVQLSHRYPKLRWFLAGLRADNQSALRIEFPHFEHELFDWGFGGGWWLGGFGASFDNGSQEQRDRQHTDSPSISLSHAYVL